MRHGSSSIILRDSRAGCCTCVPQKPAGRLGPPLFAQQLTHPLQQLRPGERLLKKVSAERQVVLRLERGFRGSRNEERLQAGPGDAQGSTKSGPVPPGITTSVTTISMGAAYDAANALAAAGLSATSTR